MAPPDFLGDGMSSIIHGYSTLRSKKFRGRRSKPHHITGVAPMKELPFISPSSERVRGGRRRCATDHVGIHDGFAFFRILRQRV